MARNRFARAILFGLAALPLSAAGASAQTAPEAATFTTIYRFQDGNDGFYPTGDFVPGPNASVFGTTNGNDGTVFQLSRPAMGQTNWKLKTIHTFSPTTGRAPDGGIVRAENGNLYGTGAMGGNMACPNGCGIVWELKPPAMPSGNWTFRILKNFKKTDGWAPHGVTMDECGNLYGTTFRGGNNLCSSGDGCGVLYKLTKPASGNVWPFSVLYKFKGPTQNDGANPWARPTLADATCKPKLWVPTYQGGSGPGSGGSGAGTLSQAIPTAGAAYTMNVIHHFEGSTGDVSFPRGAVVMKSNTLYGMGSGGGPDNCGGVYIFTKVAAQWTRKIGHFFGGGNDGCTPLSTPTVMGSTVYSSTCGASGPGTVFSLIKQGSNWNETVLRRFSGGVHGKFPLGGMVLSNTALIGATQSSGAAGCSGFGNGCGTIFSIVP